jgi:mono/diheme cytochrome c family protein
MEHMASVRTMLREALGATYDEPVPAASEEDLAEGSRLYQRRCATCHGDEGRGDGRAAAQLQNRPSNLTDTSHALYYSDQGRLWIVRNGVSGTVMPGWLTILGEEGTSQVFAYIRSLAQPEGSADGTGSPGTEHSGHVEVSAEGTRFDPAVSADRIPPGAWMCEMGGVHYASLDPGDGSCPVCGMRLTQQEGGDGDGSGHDPESRPH